MKVYKVQTEWATEDDQGSELKLFAKYEDARKCFEDAIADEINNDVTWASQYFKDGEFIGVDNCPDDVEYDYMPASEEIINRGLSATWGVNDTWGSHTYIRLSIQEVIE